MLSEFIRNVRSAVGDMGALVLSILLSCLSGAYAVYEVHSYTVALLTGCAVLIACLRFDEYVTKPGDDSWRW